MMDVDRSDVVPDFRIVGFKCTLFNDPEKCMEINSGALLVPWGNSTNITMDRYDCRGYLHDLAEHDADNVIHRSGFQTAEELATEEMCDYERYLELQTDIHEEQIFHGEYACDNFGHLVDSFARPLSRYGSPIAAKIASI
nr:splicing factor suppressor of white apricot [Hymenolepis microstoma]